MKEIKVALAGLAVATLFFAASWMGLSGRVGPETLPVPVEVTPPQPSSSRPAAMAPAPWAARAGLPSRGAASPRVMVERETAALPVGAGAQATGVLPSTRSSATGNAVGTKLPPAIAPAVPGSAPAVRKIPWEDRFGLDLTEETPEDLQPSAPEAPIILDNFPPGETVPRPVIIGQVYDFDDRHFESQPDASDGDPHFDKPGRDIGDRSGGGPRPGLDR